MNTEEIKEQIDMQKLLIENHKICLSRTEKELALLEAQLAEAEKPELLHLDFGVDGFQRWIKIGDKIWWVHKGSQHSPSVFPDSYFDSQKQGNLKDISDDLKALAEPLKKFTMKETSSAAEFSGTINKWTVYLSDHCHGTGVNIGIEDIPELILNLRRLVFTAEQEAAK